MQCVLCCNGEQIQQHYHNLLHEQNQSRNPEKLVDILNDPEEKHNLLHAENPEIRVVLEKLWKVVERIPEKDNDPIYIPLPPQPWDVDVTVKSREWKR